MTGKNETIKGVKHWSAVSVRKSGRLTFSDELARTAFGRAASGVRLSLLMQSYQGGITFTKPGRGFRAGVVVATRESRRNQNSPTRWAVYAAKPVLVELGWEPGQSAVTQAEILDDGFWIEIKETFNAD